MIHYLLFTSIFTWIFIFFSGNKLIQVPILLENWAWDKTSQQQGLSPDNRNFENQLKSSEKSINGYLTSRKRPFIFQSKKEFLIEEDEFFEIPFFGKGFISYKKIGDKITYYSQDGEILWKKPSKSYPYSTWHGKINFLISGDGNQVLFIDRNGNPTGIEQADGSFLTDIAQTSTMGSLLLFSGGEVYRIDSNAELIFKKSEKDRDNFYFYKSASISENGNLTALHYIKNNEDFISVLDRSGNTLKTYPLDKVYPHKIFIAIGNDGSLVLNLKDKILLSNSKGELVYHTEKSKSGDVYQLAFSNGTIFVVQNENKLLFLNSKGEVLKQKSVGNNHYRIIPSNNPGNFFLESDLSIISFVFLNNEILP